MLLCYFVFQSSSDYSVRNFINEVLKFNVEIVVNFNEMFSKVFPPNTCSTEW